MSDNPNTSSNTNPSQKTNASFSLSLSDDAMKAYIDQYTPAQNGGSEITLERLLKTLKAKKITYGFDVGELTQKLTQLNTESLELPLLIAQGEAAQQGCDGQLHWDIDEEKGRQAGYIVLPGQLIAHYTPATAGTPGKSVLGKMIPPNPSEEFHRVLDDGIETTTTESHEEYRAKCLGRLIYEEQAGEFAYNVEHSVQFSNGGLEAHIKLPFTASNGQAVEIKHILTTLEYAGIKHGIDEAAISLALSSKAPTDNLLVASATPAKDGIDGKLTLSDSELAAGHELEHGRIDFHERDYPKNVTKGDILGQLDMAQPGQDGINVLGSPIKARTPKEAPAKLDGLHRDDNGQLIADIDGTFIINGSSLAIADVLVIKGDVGPKTGNIHSNTAVHVKGHVEPGFVLESKKDIIVDHNIEDATVSAGEGSDITVKGGIRGLKSIITAQANLNVGFIENATISAQGDLVADISIINSQIDCKGRIKVGNKGKKGSVMGGELKAASEIEIMELGSPAAHKVILSVGMDLEDKKELRSIEHKIEEENKAIAQLQLIAQRYKDVKKPEALAVLKKVAITLQSHQTELNKLTAEHLPLAEKQEGSDMAKITINRKIYPGAVIRINSHDYEVKSELGGCIFTHNAEKNCVTFQPK